MILPKGEVVHRNLSTAYTDFPALLSTLKTGDFCGIIEIEFPENKGVIFIDTGEIINAEVKMEGNSKGIIGQEAVQIILDLSNQKDGVINIARFSPEQVAIVANNLQHEPLFKGLSADFTRLDKLLHRLKEEKHQGFIEVMTKEHQTMGILFLDAGEPVEMFTTPKSGPSGFGLESIPNFIEHAIKQGAFFDVYKSQGKILEREIRERKEVTAKKPEEEFKKLISIFQDILSYAEKLVDGSSRKKGLFNKLFKESLIENSEEFNFLDPFAGEFRYRDGTIQFTGNAVEKDFAKGILACLMTTLSHLKKELPKDKILPLKLKTGIESSFEQHRETLILLGLDEITSSIS